ncbi:hypothetical protein [Pseudoduganella namucuonensis]|uniref:hypothetical protein n=1 Tax=Pseudoduganella namucuonensis TaxID=1035707 RepID=UPI00116098D0|nr:hypothetical protein [Pseudoduganella namucuonensis]
MVFVFAVLQAGRVAKPAPAATRGFVLVPLRLQGRSAEPGPLARSAGKRVTPDKRAASPQVERIPAIEQAPPQTPAQAERSPPDVFDLSSAPEEQGGRSAMSVDLIKRDAGKIDRALRGSAPAAPLARPDSPQSRLERAFAGAARGGFSGYTVDRYVSPDGVTITRRRTAKGVACYTNGPAKNISGALHRSERDQSVNCPPEGSVWSR